MKLNLATRLMTGLDDFCGLSRSLPIYLHNYQIQDAIESESRFAIPATPRNLSTTFATTSGTRLTEIGIPADKDAIKVDAIGTVEISLDYSVPIDLLVYQFTLNFIPTQTTIRFRIGIHTLGAAGNAWRRRAGRETSLLRSSNDSVTVLIDGE